MSQINETYDEEDTVLFMGPTLTMSEMKKIFLKSDGEKKETISKHEDIVEQKAVSDDDVSVHHQDTPRSSSWYKVDINYSIEVADDSGSTSGIASSTSFSSYKISDIDNALGKSVIVLDDSEDENDVIIISPKGNDKSNIFGDIKNEKQLSDQTAPEELFKSIVCEEATYQSRVCDQSAPEGLYSTTFTNVTDGDYSKQDLTHEYPNENKRLVEQNDSDLTIIQEGESESTNSSCENAVQLSKITEESEYISHRPKSRLTLLSPPTWRKGTDESFEYWEKMSQCDDEVKGDINLDEHSIQKDNNSSDEHQNYSTARNTPLEKESDESVTPTIYGTAQNSDESTQDHIYHTARNSPTSVRSSIHQTSNKYNKECGSYENLEDNSYVEGRNTSTDSFNSNICLSSNVSGVDISYNTSQEFNDTLEEMDYLLKKAEAAEKTKNKIVEESNIAATTPDRTIKKRFFFTPPETENIVKDMTKTNRSRYFFSPVLKEITSSDKKQQKYPVTPTNSPNSKYVKKSASKTYTKPGAPQFKIPYTPRSGCRPFTVRSPVKSNYGNIVSPIGMYISRSANVPLTNIVRADKSPKRILNIMNKYTHPELYNEASKENTKSPINSPAALPIKAYKSSAITNINEQKSPSLIGPGKSDKIRKLIQGTPSHEILRHEQRLKDPLGTRLPSRSPLNVEEDSFANMSLSSAEVSVYVAKEPLRTNTLENKKK